MNTRQLALWENRSKDCPFTDFIEEDDDHCFSFDKPVHGYEVLGEDHPQLGQWLADIKNIGFGDITAQAMPNFSLPPFIPVVRHGSEKILTGSSYPFVGVMLGDLIHAKDLSLPTEVRSRFGIPKTSKIILFCYAKDALIERIWEKRQEIFPKIDALGFDLITAVNYSVWFDQPHGERLVNIKRSLLTFSEFQKYGLPAIPHIYWSGKKDLKRWSDWITQNPVVTHVAINLQTQRARGVVWEQTLEDLRFFVSILDRPLQFVITGPSRLNRIQQLQAVLPNFSLNNGHCSRIAASSFLISQEKGDMRYEYSKLPKNEIMKIDAAFYYNLMRKTSATSSFYK